MKTPKKKAKAEVILTGMTDEEFVNRAKDIGHRKMEGLRNIPKLKRCYLCKRPEGSRSFSFHRHGERLAIPKLEINFFEVKISKKMSVGYPLCHECVLL